MKVKIGVFDEQQIRNKEDNECARCYELAHPDFKYFGMKISRNGKVATLYACDNFDEAMDI